jgi:hypothetical protein
MMHKGGFIRNTRCPKCGGKVYLDTDTYGWYETCIQCGYMKNLAKVTQVNDETGDKYIAVPAEIPLPLK